MRASLSTAATSLLVLTLSSLTFASPPTKPRTTYQACGGHMVNPQTCPTGFVCIDDPRIPNNCGMACDRPGICVEDVPCGGFAGLPCEDPNKKCYDDPRDDCDPKTCADWIGLCV